MEKLTQKYEHITQALETLKKAINIFTLFVKENKAYNPHSTYEEEYRTYRDSVVQRFEYSVDLFWKYLKTYLEQAHVLIDIKVPGEIIRTAKTSGLISADEAETILTMIKSRNMTSHIYVEEFADFLAKEIPKYYATLSHIVEKLQPTLIIKQ